MERKRRPTGAIRLADVAAEAGVSLSSAAKALSGSGTVSPELVERIVKAADKLGYVPNRMASNLRGQTKGSIGLVVGNMRDPFFGKVADIVTSEAYHRSLLALVANMRRDPLLEIAMCRKLYEHRTFGLILAGGSFNQKSHFKEMQDLVRDLEQAGVTIVGLSERDLDIPTFSVDNEAVGKLLAEEVLRGGHRRVGLVFGAAESVVAKLRLKGLRSVLAKEGIDDTCVFAKELTLQGAALATDELLALAPDVSIVLAASDTLGVGAINRLQQRGRRVPEDTSVISIGNSRYCELCSPTLSSIDRSLEQYCAAAVDYITLKWAGGETPPYPKFPATLIRRGSLR